ncbi:MAG: NAD(P)H-dependent oxidoreductase [Lentimicrobium sp.]|jgi:putative NADPH-quinone reductase|nr:NAD(P)H-dependent oxidoreductase [Lentimicrobium sp.]
MRKILIVLGHPVKDTFSGLLYNSYRDGAISAGAEVKDLVIRDLNFELNFSAGYRGNQELEPDLVQAQQLILWADHIVIIFPNWWSTFPALLKGFIDRTFLPGFAFKYRKGSLLWDKLLTGRSARLIITMDAPPWYYWLVYRRPGTNAMKRGILEFCGIRPVRVTTIGSLKVSSDQKRQKWLEKVYRLGTKMK